MRTSLHFSRRNKTVASTYVMIRQEKPHEKKARLAAANRYEYIKVFQVDTFVGQEDEHTHVAVLRPGVQGKRLTPWGIPGRTYLGSNRGKYFENLVIDYYDNLRIAIADKDCPASYFNRNEPVIDAVDINTDNKVEIKRNLSNVWKVVFGRERTNDKRSPYRFVKRKLYGKGLLTSNQQYHFLRSVNGQYLVGKDIDRGRKNVLTAYYTNQLEIVKLAPPGNRYVNK